MGGVNISEWYSLVAPNADGATESIIKQYVIRTLREFCEDTLIWRTNIGPIDIKASQAEYYLSYPNAEICQVYKVLINDEPIEPVTEGYLDANEPNWRSETEATPHCFFVTADKYLTLIYTPNTNIDDGLTACCALKPKITSETVPEFLFNDYAETIANGAVSKLLNIAGNRGETLPTARYFMTLYIQGKDKAKNKALQGLTPAVLKGKRSYL